MYFSRQDICKWAIYGYITRNLFPGNWQLGDSLLSFIFNPSALNVEKIGDLSTSKELFHWSMFYLSKTFDCPLNSNDRRESLWLVTDVLYVLSVSDGDGSLIFNSWGSNQWNEKKDRSGMEDNKDTRISEYKSCKKRNDLV